ncbi:MAG: hypothetical protein GY863_10740 [bacterium]|nr:hypothetical protein [bacterium]
MKKSIITILFSAVFVFLSTVFTFSGQVISDFNLDSTTDIGILKWKSVNEEVISEYVIEFSFDNREFSSLKRFSPRGNKQQYVYIDPNFSKYSVKEFYYRLKIITHNGRPAYSTVLRYSPGISKLDQGWRTIKAIFQ